jgi:nucleotide-binding universal stress UspA family protein
MAEIRRIVCPVDFSEPSEHALAWAADLARDFGAELHLLHVYQLPIYALPDGALMAGPEFTTRVTGELQKAMAERVVRYGLPEDRTHLVEGVPWREIARMADELGASMIVMGTHGRTGLKHLLMGSVAERVVRTSNVPVVTVPNKEARAA